MTTLVCTRYEPQTIRRGFEWRYRVYLEAIDSDGVATPQPITVNGVAATISPYLSETESKDGTTPSGVVISSTVVSDAGGVIDVYIAYDETDELTVGKSYTALLWVTHATITNGKPELVRLWPLKVAA